MIAKVLQKRKKKLIEKHQIKSSIFPKILFEIFGITYKIILFT